MEAHMQMKMTLFDGDDHEVWIIKKRNLLIARDRIKDMTALHMLQMSVTDPIFLQIGRVTSSKQAWEILRAEFGETNEIQDLKLTYLKIKFDEMMMEKEESFGEYIKKMMELVNQLKFYGSNMSDQGRLMWEGQQYTRPRPT
ncbi:hypothetical protein YC2023_045356 [Brassica napus]